jgi:hypothetical protein
VRFLACREPTAKLHQQGKAAEADRLGEVWIERARALSSSNDLAIVQTLGELAFLENMRGIRT